MIRSISALALALSMGSAWGQTAPNLGLGNLQPAISTFVVGSPSFPGGLANAARPFSAGNTTDGFLANRNGFSGFAVELTRDTPAAELGTTMENLFAMGYDTLLPLYVSADEVLIPLAEPGLPLTTPVADLIEAFAQVAFMDGGVFGSVEGLSAMTGSATLPGLE